MHDNKVTALNALDKELSDDIGTTIDDFHFRDIFQKSVFHPFLVILVLMFLLQFSGQGAITFYTAQIFYVSTKFIQVTMSEVYSFFLWWPLLNHILQFTNTWLLLLLIFECIYSTFSPHVLLIYGCLYCICRQYKLLHLL